jgi:hypothetical protein
MLPVIAAGCVSTYSEVKSGVNKVDDLYVVADPGWNRAPYIPGSGNRMDSQTWTRDGALLNSLVFIPAVADGETLITSFQLGRALPAFRSDMLPNEVAELAESTFVKIYGEGNAVFNTSNLRPQLFGQHQGFMFDVEASVTDSPAYRGIAGAFIANDQLYFMYYLAVDPYYFEKDLAAADAAIKSATLTKPPQTH